MKLLQLLEGGFWISRHVRQAIQSIGGQAQEDFNYKNEHVIPKASSVYYNEICIQKKIADEAEKIVLGFEDVVKELVGIDPDEAIFMRFINSPRWDGRVYFSSEKKLLGILLGKKVNANWLTPPDWDGSLEMLESFNNKAR